MTPNRKKIHRAIVILLTVLAGCSPTKPPNADLTDAASALDAARTAGAATYAPLELRNAQDHLSQAQASVDTHDYDVAMRMARESQVDSELARIKARLGKVREQVQARIRENAQLRQDLNAGSQLNNPESQP